MTKKKTNIKSGVARKGRSTTAEKQPKLEDLQQTNGKNYEEQVAKARELEEIMGVPRQSPFRTNDPEVFGKMIEDMNLTDLQSMAVKAGVFPSGNKTVLRNKVKKAFESGLRGQGSVHLMGKPLKLDPKNSTHKEVIDYLKD